MRNHYIDNLRFLTVLLLFPYHICMIYNNYGENFYVRGPEVDSLTGFIYITSPWFMPLLFVIAGISTSYALKKRSPIEYIKERFNKLFIPLLFGILIYVPIQTYFAERYHNSYTGGYFKQYILFFTKETDLSGYTGGFTPGNLWFLLYLFIISCIALPLILQYRKVENKFSFGDFSVSSLYGFYLIPFILNPVLNISGKSVGEFFGWFILGCFLLSNDKLIIKLEAKRKPLTIFALILLAGYFYYDYLNLDMKLITDMLYFITRWVCILAIIALGKHFLNFTNTITQYLSKASFSIYIFHQSWLIAVAYYVFKLTTNIALQFILILIGAVVLTFANYELFKRIRITRFMFGIKK